MEKSIIKEKFGLPRSAPISDEEKKKRMETKAYYESLAHALIKEADQKEGEDHGTSDTPSSEPSDDKDDASDGIYLLREWLAQATVYRSLPMHNKIMIPVGALRIDESRMTATLQTCCDGRSGCFTLGTSTNGNGNDTIVIRNPRLTRAHEETLTGELKKSVESGAQMIEPIQKVFWRFIDAS